MWFATILFMTLFPLAECPHVSERAVHYKVHVDSYRPPLRYLKYRKQIRSVRAYHKIDIFMTRENVT